MDDTRKRKRKNGDGQTRETKQKITFGMSELRFRPLYVLIGDYSEVDKNHGVQLNVEGRAKRAR